MKIAGITSEALRAFNKAWIDAPFRRPYESLNAEDPTWTEVTGSNAHGDRMVCVFDEKDEVISSRVTNRGRTVL